MTPETIACLVVTCRRCWTTATGSPNWLTAHGWSRHRAVWDCPTCTATIAAEIAAERTDHV